MKAHPTEHDVGRDNCDAAFRALGEAALDGRPVSGWTHNFYRYPARFSPHFAAAAITEFSRPGDWVLDPYMGGGTAVVEGMVAGRRMIGNDLNSLAVFVAKTKITALTPRDVAAVRKWCDQIPSFRYDASASALARFVDPVKTKNLSLARARFVKKAISAALASIAQLSAPRARDFVRCVVLRAGQWALDGRQRHTSLADFRARMERLTAEMLAANHGFIQHAKAIGGTADLLNLDAVALDDAPIFAETKRQVSLVVTSPPYPGVHVLYHRWQVDGRRETPAPYWITGCSDGQGASYYNFGDRRQAAADNYFSRSLLTLRAIRHVLQAGGYMVQLVAFSNREDQLPRYLENMKKAGFSEVAVRGQTRIWRDIPHRKWHATLRGETESSREVVLVHRAT